LITMYDHRDQVVNTWFEQLIEPLGPQLFQTRIKRATAMKKARANGLAIFQYADQNPNARTTAAEFATLVHEVQNHARANFHHPANANTPTA